MIVRDWTMPLDDEDRGILAEVHRRFSQCCASLRECDSDIDAAAKALAQHLGQISTRNLPPPAQVLWADRVARPLKVDPAKPLPQRALTGMRSWPAARMTELLEALTEIDEVLEEAENEADHEAIYVEISRTYS